MIWLLNIECRFLTSLPMYSKHWPSCRFYGFDLSFSVYPLSTVIMFRCFSEGDEKLLQSHHVTRALTEKQNSGTKLSRLQTFSFSIKRCCCIGQCLQNIQKMLYSEIIEDEILHFEYRNNWSLLIAFLSIRQTFGFTIVHA